MEAQGFKKQLMAGPYGNASKVSASITLAAAPIATVIDFLRIAPGTKLNDIKVVNDALGASTTLAIGLKYENAEDGTTAGNALLAAASTASAGARTGAFHPIVFDVPVIITGTIAGAEATGKVSLVADYEYIGTK